LLLSTSGVSSAVERCLLAATQQRQGPNHQNLWGFLVFVFDGIKLFSKILLPSASQMLVTLTVFTFFVVALLCDLSNDVSRIPNFAQLQLLALMTAGIVETFCMANLAMVQNLYVVIAFFRSWELAVALELSWFLLEFFSYTFQAVGKVSSAIRPTGSAIVVFLLFAFLLCQAEKVPFDVVEAESELIDGITTEFEGFAFSLVYAAEAVIGFLALKFLLVLSGFVLAPLFFLIIAMFGGRILLARFLIVDLLEWLLSVGLSLTVLWLLVVFILLQGDRGRERWGIGEKPKTKGVQKTCKKT